MIRFSYNDYEAFVGHYSVARHLFDEMRYWQNMSFSNQRRVGVEFGEIDCVNVHSVDVLSYAIPCFISADYWQDLVK